MRLRALVIIALAAVGLIGLMRWAPWRPDKPVIDSAEPSVPDTAVAPTPGGETTAPITKPTARPGNRTSPASAATTAATPTLITNWPDKIDEILLATDPETKKAEQLLAMLPNLPLDGQEQAAQHMVNLLADEQFSATARYLNDTNTPETVITILMNDMLNRPDTVKLPMLFDLAQVTGHPLAEESKTILGIYVEHDFGDNWDEWRKGIEEYLKKEAAMNAAENPPTETPAPNPPQSN